MKAPTIAAMKPAPSPSLVPAERLAEETGKQRAGNAKQDGDDAAARVMPRHQQLRNGAGEAAESMITSQLFRIPQYISCASSF